MAENKTGGIDQQTMMYVLIGVVVVLIAVVGFMIWQRSQPAATDTAVGAATQAPATSGAAGTQAPAGMGAATASTPVDPKSSTKVSGAPKAHVQAYYDAAVKGDWKTSYGLLPAANRAQATEESFATTQKGYGIKSYKITNASEQGNKATVTVSMTTASYGDFSNQWTFEKVGGQWYVAGKKTMMGGQ
jgi:hypothetical protein